MANYDKDMAEERIQIKNDKEKIYEDDKKRETLHQKLILKKDLRKKTVTGQKLLKVELIEEK
jgi:hypothetical protein